MVRKERKGCAAGSAISPECFKSASTQAPQRRVVVVGIAGASGSGKSTVASSLARCFGSPLNAITADLYNRAVRMDPVWGTDCETPLGMDFNLLRSDMRNIISMLATTPSLPREFRLSRSKDNLIRSGAKLPVDKTVFVFVEGFLLFHDEVLARMCDVQLWIEAGCETCMLRRYHRKQKQKQSLEDFGRWYQGLVWRSYLENRIVQMENAPGALHLCGEKDAGAVAAIAEAHCRAVLQAAVPLGGSSLPCEASSAACKQVSPPSATQLQSKKLQWEQPGGSCSSSGPAPATHQEPWPDRIAASANAGVLIAGRSAEHGGIATVLLGGRFYTGKKVYEYTDFGGGLDKAERGQPQLGAFREFAEELFGLSEEDARVISVALWDAAKPALIGGAPLVHNRYAMFIVPAEALVPTLQRVARLPDAKLGASSIDHLLATGKRNNELTSLALVSLTELFRTLNGDCNVAPLSIRNLDGEHRKSGTIALRGVMVGPGGSVATCSSWLESFEQSAAQESTFGRMPKQQRSSSRGCGSSSSGRAGLQSASGSRDAAPGGQDVQAGKAVSRCEAKPFVFDMETADPDDVLTLLFLGSHPLVNLRAVTLTPGTQEQVQLVRWLLHEMGLTGVRIGAQDWPKNAKGSGDMQGRFYRNFGSMAKGEPRCESADRVLFECCDDGVTLLTGAPLQNLGAALRLDGFRLGRWVAQGGFAGEGVVPRELQMGKFVGKRTCRTWNFGNSPAQATEALATSCIQHRILVSKNVCHRAVYDDAWHQALGAACTHGSGQRLKAFQLMHSAMGDYFNHCPGSKKLHDPLALAVAIDQSVCALAEVRVFSTDGGSSWGSTLSPGSGIWISIDFDSAKFQAVLLDPHHRSAETAGPAAIQPELEGAIQLEAEDSCRKDPSKSRFTKDNLELWRDLGKKAKAASERAAQEPSVAGKRVELEIAIHAYRQAAELRPDFPMPAFARAMAELQKIEQMIAGADLVALLDTKNLEFSGTEDNGADFPLAPLQHVKDVETGDQACSKCSPLTRVPDSDADSDAVVSDESIDKQPGTRWRKRGGRSHFRRQYEVDHAQTQDAVSLAMVGEASAKPFPAEV